MGWWRNRIKEPSTMAGLSTAALIAGSVLVPPQYQIILQAVAAAFGLGAVAIPEQGSRESNVTK